MITRCIKEGSWIIEKATLGMLVLQCLIDKTIGNLLGKFQK